MAGCRSFALRILVFPPSGWCARRMRWETWAALRFGWHSTGCAARGDSRQTPGCWCSERKLLSSFLAGFCMCTALADELHPTTNSLREPLVSLTALGRFTGGRAALGDISLVLQSGEMNRPLGPTG